MSRPAGLIWVHLPRATFGLIVADGRVVEAAPYWRRHSLGRDARQVWRDLSRMGARLVWIPDQPEG